MLAELLQGVALRNIIETGSLEIRGVTHDSRKVEKGFLFVAIPGYEIDGHQFISQAIQKGAVAVVVSQSPQKDIKIPQLVVENSRKALAHIASRFFKNPSHQMRIVGITGTNGKTTVTYLLESIFKAAGRNPGVIGTINARFGGKIFQADNTTPESVDLQALMAQMLESGVTDVIMEVSSHALSLERIYEIEFDAAIFTNLSQDHLDYHKTMEDYFGAKKRLFSEYLPQSGKKGKFAVINMEDGFGEKILSDAGVRCVRAGLTGPYEIFCSSFQLSENGIQAEIRIGSESLLIRSPLLGRFNLENILVAVGLAHGLKVSTEAIQKGIENLACVPGRFEKIPNNRGVLVFVDFAHTPEALARVGEHLRKLARGRVITVFGCGGDRDRTKRPLMGREAGLFSDIVIVTSDNPRTEDPQSIINQITPGLEEIGFSQNKIMTIADREKALQKAVEMLQRGDLLLVAGKGHEDYQIVGKKKTHFSDQEILKKLLSVAS